MKNHQQNLRNIAKKVVWWKTPEETLKDEKHFLAYVMTYGDWDDAAFIEYCFGKEKLKEIILQAPAGIFDPRSWSFWQIHLGLQERPLPTRF